MDEHLELRLEELRGLLRRLELNQLEPSDGPKLDALLARAIAEAEASGNEEILIELSDEDQQGSRV